MRFDRRALLPPELDAASRARRELALELAEAALDAVEPSRCTRDAIERLRARADGGPLDGATALAFGKAAVPMARAALDAVPLRSGLVVCLEARALEAGALGGLEVRLGGHPVPADDAVETGQLALSIAESLGPGDVALCLVSGGGSAMLELPVEGLSIAELARITRRLMERGADIAELNAVRRALSRIKGGGLAAAVAPARVANVILSDVPGHPLDVVASGPTLPPPEGGPSALEVLRSRGLLDELPEAARVALRGARARAMPPIVTELAADNGTARAGVLEAARRAGVRLDPRAGCYAGEARELGAAWAKDPARGWVWGGEPTVTVVGRGHGGRNQELALAALAAGWSDGLLLTLGTDGIDGASENAGALIDPALRDEARRRGLDPSRFLADNDSASFFEAVGGALRCGPTSTNVADLCLCLP